jgi:predicted nucleic acid-binding protein
MKDKIFIDSDIILDLFLKRKPHCYSSADLFSKIENNEIEGYVSSLIFSNLFYILRKEKSAKTAVLILQKLNSLVEILSVDRNIIEEALNSEFKDLEDAIQYFTAKNNGVNIIITRNITDYSKYIKDSVVITAKEYLTSLEAKKAL